MTTNTSPTNIIQKYYSIYIYLFENLKNTLKKPNKNNINITQTHESGHIPSLTTLATLKTRL
jgi:hypothetical protein